MVILGLTSPATSGTRPATQPNRTMFNVLARQTSIQLMSRAVSLAVGIVVVGLMTRTLGPAGYGQYTTVVAFLQLVALLVGLGFSMTVSRELGSGKLPPEVLLSNALSFRVTTATAAFAMAPLVAVILGYPSVIVSGITLTTVAFWAACIGQMLTSIYQAKLRSTTLAWLELGSRALLLGGTMAVAWSGKANPTAYLLVLIVANLTITAVNLVAARRLVPFGWRIDSAVWAELWRATWPVALTTTLNVIYFKGDTVVLSLVRPAAEVGLYGVAYSMLEALLALPAIIGGLLLPLLAKAQTQQDHGAIRALYIGAADTLLAAGLAVVVGSVLVGHSLIGAIAGANFTVSGDILAILSLAILASFVGNAAGYAIFALGYQRSNIPVFAWGALGGVVGYLVFIPRYSYWGAAWVTVALEVAVNLAMLSILWRRGLKLSTARWPKIGLATLVLALGLLLPLPLVGKLVVGAVLYLGALWKLNLVPHRLTAVLADLH